jgi:CheY-like chemotaxis protein
LSIADEGTGIPAEHLAKIFDPYFTTKAKGNGLGLATSYSIIKAHGGHISVTSTAGHGARFVVHLPASAMQAAHVAVRGDTGVRNAGGRVLIVDDEEEVRKVAVRLLKRLGYTSEAVSDGSAAITRYVDAQRAGLPFDIVMMDLTIPGGMGGLETIEHLRRIDPGVTAIVSSGYADSSAMADFDRFGFRGVIAKPYDPAEFKATFERLAARPALRAQ